MSLFVLMACSCGSVVAQTLTAEKKQEVDALTKQIAGDASNYELYGNRGLLFLKSGNVKDATNDFDQALRLNPKWQKGYVYKGLALKKSGKLSEAVDAFNEADKLRELSAPEIGERGILNYRLKRYQAAISDFDRVIKLQPDDFKAYSARACALWEFKGPSNAVISDLEKSLALNPSDSNSRTMLEQVKIDSAHRPILDND